MITHLVISPRIDRLKLVTLRETSMTNNSLQLLLIYLVAFICDSIAF